MNFVFATVCAILMVQISAAWEPEDETCSKKLNIERAILEKLTEKLIHVTDDETYNKYSECYWQEKKMLNEDGSIDWDAVKKEFATVIPSGINFQSVIDKCKAENISGKDVGQTIVKNQNCMMKELFGESSK
ncbi:hypothetical protein FQR65_LT00527 [Abscondita terminalis]|nr:hypothetical protein FQR65_LT00527 [Abscondita terminalis]